MFFQYINLKYAGFCPESDSSYSDSYSDSDIDTDRDSVFPCFHLRFSFTMAQNYRAGEYINVKYVVFSPNSDSSDNESDSDSDSVSLYFMMG